MTNVLKYNVVLPLRGICSGDYVPSARIGNLMSAAAKIDVVVCNSCDKVLKLFVSENIQFMELDEKADNSCTR